MTKAKDTHKDTKKVGSDSVSRDGTKVMDVRLAPPDVLQALQDKPQPPTPSSSIAYVIRAAIAEYAKTDPRLRPPPSDRYRAYRSYISSRGFDPRKDRGFSDKTFERYEQEFRRKSK